MTDVNVFITVKHWVYYDLDIPTQREVHHKLIQCLSMSDEMVQDGSFRVGNDHELTTAPKNAS